MLISKVHEVCQGSRCAICMRGLLGRKKKLESSAPALLYFSLEVNRLLPPSLIRPRPMTLPSLSSRLECVQTWMKPHLRHIGFFSLSPLRLYSLAPSSINPNTITTAPLFVWPMLSLPSSDIHGFQSFLNLNDFSLSQSIFFSTCCAVGKRGE